MADKILVRTGAESNIGVLDAREPGLTNDTHRPVIGTAAGSKLIATEQKVTINTPAPAALAAIDRSLTAIACDTDAAGADIALDIRAGGANVPTLAQISVYGSVAGRKVTVQIATGVFVDVPVGSVSLFVWDGLKWYVAAGLLVSTFMHGLLDDPDAATAVGTLTSIKAVASVDYTVLDNDGYTDVEVTTGAANRTITLPARSTNAGRHLRIRKVDSGAGKVIVARAGADTINGTTTWEITEQFGFVDLRENGTEWAVAAQEGSVYRATNSSGGNVTPVAGTWYNLASFALSGLPAGFYEISYQAIVEGAAASTGVEFKTTLSTGNNNESDSQMTDLLSFASTGSGAVSTTLEKLMTKRKRISVAAGTTFYLNEMMPGGGSQLYLRATVVPAIIEARRIG